MSLVEALAHVSMLERMQALNAQYPSKQHEWLATKGDIKNYFNEGSIQESDNEVFVKIPGVMIGGLKVAFDETAESAYTVKLINYRIKDADAWLGTKYYLTTAEIYHQLISDNGLAMDSRIEVISTMTYILGDIGQAKNRQFLMDELLKKGND